MLSIFEAVEVGCDGPQDTELLRRNNWVTAMPMEANERDVRSQARNVRSVSVRYGIPDHCVGVENTQSEVISCDAALIIQLQSTIFLRYTPKPRLMGSCIFFIGLGLGLSLIIIVVMEVPVGIDILICPCKIPIGAVVAFSIIYRLRCWMLGLSVLSCFILVIFIVPRISSSGLVVSR